MGTITLIAIINFQSSILLKHVLCAMIIIMIWMNYPYVTCVQVKPSVQKHNTAMMVTLLLNLGQILLFQPFLDPSVTVALKKSRTLTIQQLLKSKENYFLYYGIISFVTACQ